MLSSSSPVNAIVSSPSSEKNPPGGASSETVSELHHQVCNETVPFLVH